MLFVKVSGTYTANLKFDFIDHEVKKAFEWLSAQERNEGNVMISVADPGYLSRILILVHPVSQD
jgi:hypothetical protein